MQNWNSCYVVRQHSQNWKNIGNQGECLCVVVVNDSRKMIRKNRLPTLLQVRIVQFLDVETSLAFAAVQTILASVHGQMVCVPLLVHKRLGTIVTMILYPFVCSHVFLVLRVVAESSSARFTIEFKLPRVQFHVVLETRFWRKFLPTLAAGVDANFLELIKHATVQLNTKGNDCKCFVPVSRERKRVTCVLRVSGKGWRPNEFLVASKANRTDQWEGKLSVTLGEHTGNECQQWSHNRFDSTSDHSQRNWIKEWFRRRCVLCPAKERAPVATSQLSTRVHWAGVLPRCRRCKKQCSFATQRSLLISETEERGRGTVDSSFL